MRDARAAVAASLAALCAAAHAADVAPLTDAFDGAWTVAVHCPDTRDEKGLVKGYDFVFDARVDGGRIDAQYGSPGMPSSVHLTGEIRNGGVAEVRAEGMTGSNEYSVGRVATGTAYHYTMTGRFVDMSGEAVRREVRPCTARFAKKPPPSR